VRELSAVDSSGCPKDVAEEFGKVLKIYKNAEAVAVRHKVTVPTMKDWFMALERGKTVGATDADREISQSFSFIAKVEEDLKPVISKYYPKP
jgi:predicted membrane-bound spermidine synthase